MLTIVQLRQSTALAKPQQGESRPVSILSTNPTLQNKTLTINAEARGEKIYQLVLVFYNVQYSLERDGLHPLTVRSRLGDIFYMQPVSESINPIQVRCNCPYYRFAWAHWNRQEKALSGPAFPTYIRKTATRPEVNSSHLPGVCKHLLSLFERLRKDKILGD